jgi:hypothetical protein
MTGFSSQLGKAILGRMQLGNVAVSGTTSTNQTITGRARIAGTTTQTITGVARLSATISQTIAGTYLIASEAPPRCPPLVVAKVVPSSYLLEICERKGT